MTAASRCGGIEAQFPPWKLTRYRDGWLPDLAEPRAHVRGPRPAERRLVGA